jgi:hypothetical protein
MEVKLDSDPRYYTTGVIKSSLSGTHPFIDGIEALILAAACSGINIETPAFIEAIETAVDALANKL